MFYGNNYPGYQPQYSQPMQQPDYQQQRMAYLQSMQPQQSGIQARFVASREEAMAAAVFPGYPIVFVNRAAHEAYYKNVDQQGNVEFEDFFGTKPEPQQPLQYATIADIEAIRGEMAQLRDMIPAQPTRRTKGADTE